MTMWHCEKCLGTPGFGAGCVCPRNAQPAASAESSDETLRLAGVIADKIEDGTLFQAGIFSRRDLADKVRAVVRAARHGAQLATAPTIAGMRVVADPDLPAGAMEFRQPAASAEPVTHHGDGPNNDEFFSQIARQKADDAVLASLHELVALESDGKHADESSIEAWERARAAIAQQRQGEGGDQ